jgi:hypothetical protein
LLVIGDVGLDRVVLAGRVTVGSWVSLNVVTEARVEGLREGTITRTLVVRIAPIL